MKCEIKQIEFSNNFESAKYHKLIFYTKNMLVQFKQGFRQIFSRNFLTLTRTSFEEPRGSRLIRHW